MSCDLDASKVSNTKTQQYKFKIIQSLQHQKPIQYLNVVIHPVVDEPKRDKRKDNCRY